MGKYAIYGETLTGIADAIRKKTGDAALLSPIDMAAAIAGIQTGGGSGSGGSGGGAAVAAKDVNFYDYDGTLVHSYTVAEAQALSELPAGPEHEGLVFQKWNWSLENVKALTRPMNIGALYTTDDGTTRIYIHLEEGCTSPMLGVGVNGTVTVDWGDGTAPDTLTGTSINTAQWTGNHEYSSPGDYIIKLTVDGTIGFTYEKATYLNFPCILRSSRSWDGRNFVYLNAIRWIECGNGVTSIDQYAFNYCRSLSTITLPIGLTSIGAFAFDGSYSLSAIAIPDDVKKIDNAAFRDCRSLSTIALPNGLTSINNGVFNACGSLDAITLPDSVATIVNNAFVNCHSLSTITLPNGLTSIEYNAFSYCLSLSSITIPGGVTLIDSNAFSYCYSLSSITISDGVKSIGDYAFDSCGCLVSITLPDSVMTIGGKAFVDCSGVKFYDFSKHTAVPTLANTNAFSAIPTDCEIRVPAALYDEWIAAANWSTYASQIVAV